MSASQLSRLFTVVLMLACAGGIGMGQQSGGAGSVDAPSNSMNLSSTSLSETADVARVSSLDSSDLVEFAKLLPPVQKLLMNGLALTRQNLFYKYGSDDPVDGGMDCSGTIHYLLQRAGLDDVPRDASELYAWAWKAGRFQAVNSTSPDTFELSRLHPGDLLFWTGTYRVAHDPPVTHVMIYLGTSRLTGRRVMVGASDGRTFNGQPRFGVSVFDFKMPGSNASGERQHGLGSGDSPSRFIGYSPIPGLEKAIPLDEPSPAQASTTPL